MLPQKLLVSPSDVPSCQKKEWPVLCGIGSLEFVTQSELPLIFQLQADDRLAEGVAVLTDHAQGRTCMDNGRGVRSKQVSLSQ